MEVLLNLIQHRMFPIRTLLVAGAVLLSPILAHSAVIDVNGVCQFNCLAGPGTLLPGQAITQTYNFDVAVNGDLFNISGSIVNKFPSSTFLGFYPTITYVGPTLSTSTDTITLDMLQNFADPLLSNPSWDGSYNEVIPFDLPVAGESASGQVLYNGQTVGVLGPVFGSGNYYLTQVSTLSNLDGNPLDSDYKLSFTFPAGVGPGTIASSPSPEPAEALLLGLGSLGLLLVKGRKFMAGRKFIQ